MKYLTYILLTVVIVGGGYFLLQEGPSDQSSTPQSNVINEAGKQVIEINVKGGYSPRVSIAKADVPTILKMKTNGTFDCSSSVVIPSIGYRNNLPSSGETEIEVPAQSAGTTLQGMCEMGMYNFQVKFN